MKTTIFAVMMLISSSAYAGWFGPDNYDDCILENIKPSMSNSSLLAIKNACRGKFPLPLVEIPLVEINKHCVRKNLTTTELEKLKLTTKDGHYELYNGNEFLIDDVNMRFQVKGREYPIEKQISYCNEGADEFCRLISSEGFIAKNYTEAYGIPENMTTYMLLPSTRTDCQQ